MNRTASTAHRESFECGISELSSLNQAKDQSARARSDVNGEEKQHFLCSIPNNASQRSCKPDAQCDIAECIATSIQYEFATQARFCVEALIAFQPKIYQVFRSASGCRKEALHNFDLLSAQDQQLIGLLTTQMQQAFQ